MALAERPGRDDVIGTGTGTGRARIPAFVLPAIQSRAWPRLSARTRVVLVLLFVTLVKQLIVVAVYPPFQGHDEVGHYGYLWTLAQFGRLPTLSDNLPVALDPWANFSLDWPALYTANHPPLYYLLVLPIWKLLGPGADPLTRLYALRLTAIVPFLLTVWLTYRLATTLFPRDHFLALTAPAAIAFAPQLSFEGAIVNNDALSICFGALILYLCAAALRRGLSPRAAFALGLALGGGLLVKATITVFLPLVAGVALWCRRPQRWERLRERGWWRDNLVVAAALIVPLVALSAPWYAFLKWTYGDFSAFAAIRRLQAAWNTPAGAFSELLFSKEFHLERIREYWGYFGWKLIPLTAHQERAVQGALILCGVGLIVGLARVLWAWRAGRVACDRVQIAGIVLLVAANVLMYGAMIYFGTMFLLTQARYTFPVAAATALLALLGLRALIPERFLRPAAALTITALAAFNFLLLFGSVIPYALF